MRWLGTLVLLLSVFLGLVAVTFCGELSNLDFLMQHGVTLQPLTKGDLSQMVSTEAFWWGFPCFAHPQVLISLRPGLLMLAIAGVLVFAAKKRPLIPKPVLGSLAMASGCIPYAIGWLALQSNEDLDQCGPWVMFMLCGIAYACGLAVLFVMHGVVIHLRAKSGHRSHAQLIVEPAN